MKEKTDIFRLNYKFWVDISKVVGVVILPLQLEPMITDDNSKETRSVTHGPLVWYKTLKKVMW